MSWPEWCYLPLGGWYAVVSQQRTGGGLLTSLRDSADVSRLGRWGHGGYANITDDQFHAFCVGLKPWLDVNDAES